jgi:hypothetical protein
VINATGIPFNSTQCGFFVKPVRNTCCTTTLSDVYYNPSTGEFFYS